MALLTDLFVLACLIVFGSFMHNTLVIQRKSLLKVLLLCRLITDASLFLILYVYFITLNNEITFLGKNFFTQS